MALAAQIDGNALLTRIGDGHTSVYSSESGRGLAGRAPQRGESGLSRLTTSLAHTP